MNSKIKIAVIGGTGKSGTYLVREMIHQGFQIKLLLRNPEHLPVPNPLIEVVHGNVTSYPDVLTLLEGCSAVISTLGLGIPASEPTIFSQATTHILQAMKEQGILRYIVTTGLNVDAPGDHKGPAAAAATLWMKEHYPVSTADKQKELEILSHSDRDWTLVRLPRIEQTDKRNEVSISLEDCLADVISAADLAAFLISQLQDDTFIRRSPFIANA